MPDRYRVTKDIDLLGSGSSEVSEVVKIVRDVCVIPYEDDAISFDLKSIRGERIKSDDEYMGVRVKFFARLGSAKIGLQLDVGFGDKTFPQPTEGTYLSILGLPAPKLKMYHMETSIAEKFHAMVELGKYNSRMKDFYDIWQLSQEFDLDKINLWKAIQETFHARETEVPH